MQGEKCERAVFARCAVKIFYREILFAVYRWYGINSRDNITWACAEGRVVVVFFSKKGAGAGLLCFFTFFTGTLNAK